MRKLVPFALLVLVLAACGTTVVDVTGRWEGTISDGTDTTLVTIELTDSGGQLTGTALIGGLVTANVTGDRMGREAFISMTSPVFEGVVTIEGTFSGDSFSGTVVDGGGTVELRRD